MGPKTSFVFCLLCLSSVLCVEAQRDGRRRSGRRKPTTESPAMEEPENENNPQKLDAESDSIANLQPLEAPSLSKESNANNSGGPPFIVPRGTRKPRPMNVRGNGEARPKPTLPTFARKHSGRIPKPDRQDIKKSDENQLASTSTTTSKPARNSSRRRNNSQTSEKVVPSSEKSSQPGESSETSTEAPSKKRFGGGRRGQNSRGGSRRITPVDPET